MRIAYLCTDFGIPIHGTKGASVHVRELTRALMAQGHEVLILASRVGGAPPDGFDVPVVELPPEPDDEALHDFVADDPAGSDLLAGELRAMLYSSSLRHRAAALLRDWRPDAIYERYALFGLAGAALAAEFHAPLLVEVNAPLAAEQARYRGATLKAATLAAEKRVLQSADVVFVVSEALAVWAAGRGVDLQRIRVVPNAVDPARFAGTARHRAAMRAALCLDRRPVVGFVGTLKPWHDTASLLRAARLLCEAGHELQLLIVGDGPERPALEALAAETGLADVIRFSGSVPHNAIPQYLAAMDVATIPYATAEDCYFSPLKLFEYQAAGLPVVAAAAGGVGHCVRDAVTGATYRPGDDAALAVALASVIEDAARSPALGRAGRAHVEEAHTWARTAITVAAAAGEPRRRDEVGAIGLAMGAS